MYAKTNRISVRPTSWSSPVGMDRMVLVVICALLAGPQCHAIAQTQTKEGVKVEELTLTELRQQRKEMAWRKRRIIFNNDGDDILSAEAVTAEGLLKQRTTALLDSQVDAIWYYPGVATKLFLGDGPWAELYAFPLEGLSHGGDNLARLIENEGRDALEIMIETARQHDMEIFYSNRMNDTHDSFQPDILYNIKREHPEYMLSTQEEGAKHSFPDVKSFWAAWNFEHEEIRDLTVEALREVCQTYDIDGIELDFMRHYLYFPETLQGRAVTAEHLEIINEMVRRIRTMTEEEGLRRSRPILVAARCAGDLTLSRSVGMDVETWLKEGLIDILVVGRCLEFMIPMKPMFDLAHRYEVPVYPRIALSDYKHKDHEDLAMYRGDAMFRYWEGADGMYMFNVFTPTLPLWWQLGDPEKLTAMDKDYVWDYLPSHHHQSDLLWDLRVALRRPPVAVTAEGCEPMPLFVGEDLSAAPPQGKQRKLTLRVHVTGLTASHQLTVQVNGQALLAPQVSPPLTHQPQDVWLEYEVSGNIFQPGENDVEARLTGEEALQGTVKIDEVKLQVRYY